MVESFKYNNLNIEPNFDGWKIKYRNDELIHIYKEDTEQYVGLALKDAIFVRDSLSQVIEYYNSIPEIHSKVEITNGLFKGYQGEVTDIDECDSKRPVVVKLYDTDDFNDCTCFVHYNDIKII